MGPSLEGRVPKTLQPVLPAPRSQPGLSSGEPRTPRLTPPCKPGPGEPWTLQNS